MISALRVPSTDKRLDNVNCTRVGVGAARCSEVRGVEQVSLGRLPNFIQFFHKPYKIQRLQL